MAVLRRFLPKTYDQMDQYALDWDAANSRAAVQSGPLWVVLGDSAAQGVGCPSYDSGYVGQVLEVLRVTSGRPWRVLNLSKSGARTLDVAREQCPRLLDLPAELVTALVGGNDIVWTPLDQWRKDLELLYSRLPADSVVGTTTRGLRKAKCVQVNEHVYEVANYRDLKVADLWNHTGPPYQGLFFDGFHPNERGYAKWADALLEVMGLPVTS
jgi:acyl-CoA thioesterase-1